MVPLAILDHPCFLAVASTVPDVVTLIGNIWQFLLSTPYSNKSVKHFGHSFAFDALKIWNDLPNDVLSATSVTTFSRQFKIHLFLKTYLP